LDFFLAISMIYIDLYIGNKHPNQPWLGVVDWVPKCPKNHFGGINQGLESCFCILRQEISKTSVHKKKTMIGLDHPVFPSQIANRTGGNYSIQNWEKPRNPSRSVLIRSFSIRGFCCFCCRFVFLF
jgi:hypothetical protein